VSALLVMLGAAVGAPSRFLLDRWLQQVLVPNHPRRIAVGTLVVNILGSAVLGFADARLTGQWLLLVGSGFCGSFTTFSTFAALTEESFREGWKGTAWASILVSMALCPAAFAATYWLAGGW
jgi:CrcB protein